MYVSFLERSRNIRARVDLPSLPVLLTLPVSLTLLVLLALVLIQPAWAATPAKSSFAYAPALGAASPSLDVYAGAGATNAPVLVYVLGGAWVAGRKSAVNAKPQHFTDAGYVFVSLGYRLAPTVEIEQQLNDIDTALGWIAANIAPLGGDAGKVISS